jgi:2-hydroxy-3-oxopropionate reductase
MVSKVGFIGVGNMGKPMAVNVVRGGFDLMVYDLREESLRDLAGLGAKVGRSSKEVAEHGEVVEVMVLDDAQVEEVVLGEEGVLSGAKPGTVIAIHSTVHPGTIRKVAERAKFKGIGVIDAEVSGGGRGAETRSLAFMVGGEKEYLEKCRPVFETSGKEVFHMGELGMGAVTKAAHQVVVAGTMMAVAEGMLLAERAGIDPETFEQVMHVSTARSFMADNWLGNFKFMGWQKSDSFHKSVTPGLELAHELGLALPLTAHAQQLFSVYVGGEKK